MMMLVTNVMRLYADPTAASASLPTNLPTIAVSVMLYSCWSRLPIVRGSANSSIDFTIGPCTRSLAIR